MQSFKKQIWSHLSVVYINNYAEVQYGARMTIMTNLLLTVASNIGVFQLLVLFCNF